MSETHLGSRLAYRHAGEVEPALNDSLYGDGAKRILRRALVGSALVWFVPFGSIMLSGLSGRTSTVLSTLSLALPGAWFLLTLLLPRNEVLGEWHLLLDDKAELADTAYGTIFQSLRDGHAIPAAIKAKRVRTGPPVRGVRNTLRIEIGPHRALVTAFPFGNDLFLGWTLVRRRVPIVIVFQWVSSLRRTDDGFPGAVEGEAIKAMRDAVHNAALHGVEAALAGRRLPITETFGHDVPVEPAAPVPAVVGAAGTGSRPAVVTVLRPVDVFSVEDREQVIGQAHPGVSYELIGEDGGAGLVVRDSSGSVALVKDPAAVLENVIRGEVARGGPDMTRPRVRMTKKT